MKRLLLILCVGIFVLYGAVSGSVTVDQQETNTKQLVTGSESIADIKQTKQQTFSEIQNKEDYQITTANVSLGISNIAIIGIIVVSMSVLFVQKRR